MPRVMVLGISESDVLGVAASVAGLNYFVTSAWDEMSLADAVANGSPEIVIVDLRKPNPDVAVTKNMISEYDQVGEAPRLVVCQNTKLPELQSRYFDDFILYPFDNDELSMRLLRLLNKSQKTKSGTLVEADGLVVDTESFEVSVDGRQLSLTFKEFELLRYLATRTGRVHTREALLNQVWGYEYFGGLRTVDVHVRRIRAKLGPKHEDLIQTVHGVGYKFVHK
jgi:DNA-binding response OmpR family regulator